MIPLAWQPAIAGALVTALIAGVIALARREIDRRVDERVKAAEGQRDKAIAERDILQTQAGALTGANGALAERVRCLEDTVSDQTRRIDHLEQLVQDLNTENRRLRAEPRPAALDAMGNRL